MFWSAVFLVADRLFDRDAFPIGFQLVGQHHRQGGADSGAHLRAVGDDDYSAVGLDAQVHAGVPGRVVGLARRERLRQNPRAQDQGARREDAFQERRGGETC